MSPPAHTPPARSFRVLAREVVYAGFFRLVRYRLRHALFAGGWSPELVLERFERGESAAVLPYDPLRDEVVLIEQFRIGALEAAGGAWLREIVAGVVEPGETPEQVVRREAAEEAGCTVTALQPVCDYLVSPGGTSERMHLFIGRVDAAGAGGIHGLEHENEDIRVQALPVAAALELLTQGAIGSAAPIIALQWLALHRDDLRAQWGA